MNEKKNILKDYSFAFAVRSIRLYKHLVDKKKEFVLSRQLLRSGTSIGASVEEANQVESKSDFIHKLSIANKEANETQYWLRLLKDAEILEEKLAASFLADISEILKLLTAIIKKSKANNKKQV